VSAPTDRRREDGVCPPRSLHTRASCSVRCGAARGIHRASRTTIANISGRRHRSGASSCMGLTEPVTPVDGGLSGRSGPVVSTAMRAHVRSGSPRSSHSWMRRKLSGTSRVIRTTSHVVGSRRTHKHASICMSARVQSKQTGINLFVHVRPFQTNRDQSVCPRASNQNKQGSESVRFGWFGGAQQKGERDCERGRPNCDPKKVTSGSSLWCCWQAVRQTEDVPSLYLQIRRENDQAFLRRWCGSQLRGAP